MKPNEMRFAGHIVIGLTGTIASGKSTVLHYLEETYGCEAIDADLVARGVVEDSKEDLQALFGPDVIRDGHVDRTRLGKIVFQDPEKLSMLNQLVHPRTCRKIGDMIEASLQEVVIVEAIELLRSDLKEMIDEVWVVYASPSTRIERMMKTREMAEEAAEDRIKSQWDDASYIRQADVVIPSDQGGLLKMFAIVDEEFSKLRMRYPSAMQEGRKEDDHA